MWPGRLADGLYKRLDVTGQGEGGIFFSLHTKNKLRYMAEEKEKAKFSKKNREKLGQIFYLKAE